MRRLLSRQGIRYTCRLLTENSRLAFLMLVTKIQRPKILKWKKKSINNKKNNNNKQTKKRQPQAWHLRVRFRWISRRCKQYTVRERVAYRCQLHALITRSLKYELANTCLTTACLANNGTCRRCEKHAADYYCSFKMLPTVRITRGGL